MVEVESDVPGRKPDIVLYTARTRTIGGRENGTARSSDGRLDVTMSVAGSTRIGTNPEQLLAAAWSASFGSTIALAARRRTLSGWSPVTIDAEVTLSVVNSATALSVRFLIGMPDMRRDLAGALIEEAEQDCPFFRATRGNVDVAIELVGAGSPSSQQRPAPSGGTAARPIDAARDARTGPSPTEAVVQRALTTTVSAQATWSLDLKLEVTVIPVADVDRAKLFYAGLGWRLDADFVKGERFRVVQFTPPGSACSIHFGTGLTSSLPGSAQLYLVVSDIEAARHELAARGALVSDVFHAAVGEAPVRGVDPERRSYVSSARFADPDGNGWIVQEVTTRLPGRVEINQFTFSSPGELALALRRAAAAHGEHEKRTGRHDAAWPDWYAEYIVRALDGKELPR